MDDATQKRVTEQQELAPYLACHGANPSPGWPPEGWPGGELVSAAPEAASVRGSVDDPLARLREAEREARGRLLGHPEIDGEGIRLALEHEWALLDLRSAALAARAPRSKPRTRLAG